MIPKSATLKNDTHYFAVVLKKEKIRFFI